jgi:hypothetical protein
MPVAAENMVRKRFMLQLLQVDWFRGEKNSIESLFPIPLSNELNHGSQD